MLSDDWGTGVAVEWLDSQFQYQYVGHGRNTMLELKRQGLTAYVGKKKRGPQKCPDFFCIDPAGRYHLIECKGNQSGHLGRFTTAPGPVFPPFDGDLYVHGAHRFLTSCKVP